MSRTFFFGNNESSQQSSQYLVQFKAGKLVKNGNLVTPIKDRKGMVYLHQSQDQLMHFCWKDRTTGEIVDDLILFPDDAEFLKVPQCTTGRVFVLKFKTSPRRLFFWSQEPKEDKDEEVVNKINEYINNPPSSRGGGHSMLSSDMSNPEDDLRNLFSNSDMSPQQLMSVLGGVRILPSGLGSLLRSAVNAHSGSSGSSGSSGGNSSSNRTSSLSTTPAAPQTPNTTPAVISSAPTSESSSASGTNPGPVKLADLQAIISGMASNQGTSDNDVSVDLASSINVDVLRPLLSDENFLQQIRDKLPPIYNDSPRNSSSISYQFTQTIHSPQFQEALGTFCQALQSGQLGPLIRQFGLPDECIAAAHAGSLEAFVKGLQKQQSSSSSSEEAKTKESKEDPSNKSKKDNDDDEGMSA